MSDSSKIFTGTVAWFDPKKGYGFITKDEDSKDIFCHYSDISMEGFKVIMAGDRVSFEESRSFKEKLKAVIITITERKGGRKKAKE